MGEKRKSKEEGKRGEDGGAREQHKKKAKAGETPRGQISRSAHTGGSGARGIELEQGACDLVVGAPSSAWHG